MPPLGSEVELFASISALRKDRGFSLLSLTRIAVHWKFFSPLLASCEQSQFLPLASNQRCRRHFDDSLARSERRRVRNDRGIIFEAPFRVRVVAESPQWSCIAERGLAAKNPVPLLRHTPNLSFSIRFSSFFLAASG